MKKKNIEKVDFKYNLSIYFSLLKNYKNLFSILLFITLILEASYVADRFLFKIIIDNGAEYLARNLEINAFLKILINIAFVYIGIIIIRYIGKWLYLHVINRLDANLILDLKRKFFNHLIHLSHNFHISHKTGSLISRLIRGGGAVERITDIIVFNVAPLIFQLTISGISLIYFNLTAALIVLLTGIVFIAYSIIIQNAQKSANLKANEAEDFEKANISDIFTNFDSIKYFGKEKNIKEKFFSITEKTKFAMLKNWDYYKWLDSGQVLILGIGTLFLIYFPLIEFLNYNLSLGALSFIYATYGAIVMHLFGSVHSIREYYRSMVDFESLFQYGKIENEIKDNPNARELKIGKGMVEFKNINFSYHERKLFGNFNLKVNENEKVALVGPSGSGKTTLIKLFYRLYDVDKGEILIDDRNIKEFKQESLRAELSIVPQECVLFDDTIYNNIAFSNPESNKKQVMNAMKFAQLDKIVKLFPKKEHTIVGERGVKLSGGEKQRVSIARAILADKKILVLDEATSSLDSQTEHEIQRDLQKLMKGRTSIIIAHRLSTIMKADNIVVMDKGKIVAMGKHKELIKQEGLYKRLWNLQKGGYIK